MLAPPLIRPVNEKNNKEKVQCNKLVGTYSTWATNSALLAVNHDCGNISVIIIKRQKDDKWLIYRANTEIDLTKHFSGSTEEIANEAKLWL